MASMFDVVWAIGCFVTSEVRMQFSLKIFTTIGALMSILRAQCFMVKRNGWRQLADAKPNSLIYLMIRTAARTHYDEELALQAIIEYYHS